MLTELLKLKRRPIFLYALLSSGLPPLINWIYTLNLPANSPINRTFREFGEYSFAFTEWMFLPCLLGLLGSILFFSERENGTLKELMIVPVDRAQFLLSKFTILLLFSVLFMASTAFFTATAAWAVGYAGITARSVGDLLGIYVAAGLLIGIAMLPVLCVVVIAKREYILSICATLIYSISGIIFSSYAVGIHPLASVAALISSAGGANPNADPAMCLLNLSVVSLCSIGASLYAFQRQNIP
jgi:ABC-type transport system involved in multi-copper enzyme maturation permease subunit